MGNYDVITSGYVSMDHIIKIKSPAEVGFTSLVTNKTNSKIYYGGCSVNIAYALCKLGLKSMPILRVGEDYEELGFKKFLEEGNVPIEGITKIKDETTSTCYLLQDNNNDHITIFYPGAMDGKYSRDLEDEIFENTKLAVITVASVVDNKEFFEKCKKHKVPIVFGMKDDFDAFPEEFLKELLTYSKIIFTNEVEREIIEKIYGFKTITELFDIGNVDIIVTTLGKDGSICYERTEDGIKEKRIGIFPVENIVDATGSGDAYMSGFIYGYLNKFEMKDCCKLGGALSSFVLQKEGCCTNMPTEEELLNKFNQFKEEI
ncbi:PfkB family carbohydrate kinase [Clostridium botulinum]|uniref:Carbohydrate kinase family protein n=1 Tax=Clostridium botulinum TaxID=1491 RepID=A0A6B4JR04_CLOBO|nr:PfkB family carbohydrate kinase [Clostridium botulinum]EES47743.1 kinase, PfkB family [Clostridium botulinum E1 str. 'BoNT E Beluga']MBY6762641.1 carbohydrate kinase family protein [Clostridium botulinum]MBY6921426.1 carbohydrate kinase family protein [Clostridium botulinum]MCR1132342.1 PfkB family carbohydrate kinase [Clostridium botulinum]NFH70697.1 carbohydrate kinase family protein [Clostridium botulinum]